MPEDLPLYATLLRERKGHKSLIDLSLASKKHARHRLALPPRFCHVCRPSIRPALEGRGAQRFVASGRFAFVRPLQGTARVVVEIPGVALGYHVTAPSGRIPSSGTFSLSPRRGINRLALGNALRTRRETPACCPERA